MTARGHAPAREARPLYGELARELRRQLRLIDRALDPRRAKDEQLWGAHDDIHRVRDQLAARGLIELADKLLLAALVMRCSLPPRRMRCSLPRRRRRPRK